MRRGKQNHLCVDCGRQFSDDVRRIYLRTYLNGNGVRAIERVPGVHHTTVITWVKETVELLPDTYDPDEIPEVGELDELQTFCGNISSTS